MLSELWQDLRFAFRLFKKNPAVTLSAILTLAVGIGANTAIFTVVNAVLVQPLPYPNSDRIVMLSATSALRGFEDIPLSEAEYNEFRAQAQSLENIAAYASGALNLSGIDQAQRVGVTEVSVGLFSVLGVTPYLGRVFTPEEDLPGRDPVVIVSYRVWQRHFGSNAGLVGKTITLNGRTRPVIGVMPPGFNFPNDEIDVWMPLNLEPTSTALNTHYLYTVGSLKPGVTVAQAKSEVQLIYGRLKEKYPEYYRNEAGAGMTTIPLREKLVGGIRLALLLMLGAVVFILLIACANVANLLLARAAARQKEISLRSALGARRGRIVRQLLTESLLLSIIGGALGLLLAVVSLRLLLVGSPLDAAQAQSIHLDLRALGFTMVVAVIVGVLFGLAPALQASQPDLNQNLKEGGRGSMQGMRHNRTRTLLVISEVTLSMVLLIGAGLMIQSFLRLLKVDPGFRAENVLTMRLTLPGAKYRENQQVTGFFQQFQDRVAALPGVQSSAIINQLPAAAERSEASFEIEGRELTTEIDREAAIADYRMISPNYFKAMGITLLRGRPFTDQDGRQSPPVAIINEKLAHRFWPGEDATTKRIRLRPDAPWLPIVGVVPDIKNQGLSVDTNREMYFPYVETSFGLPAALRTMTLVIRTTTDPAPMADVVRNELHSVDPDLPAYKVLTMEQVVAASVSKTRFVMLLLTVFAGVALVLAAGGVYSVMAYSVAQRTHEIGIRKALGAQSGDIFKLIMGQGFILAAIGVGLGAIAAFALTRVMANLLFTVSATDPKVFIGVALLLTAVALLACFVPARRATRVQPMTALREE